MNEISRSDPCPWGNGKNHQKRSREAEREGAPRYRGEGASVRTALAIA